MFNILKNKNLMPYERNGCSHNWVHNAGMQCNWDINNIPADSIHLANMYICTMCGEMLWSLDKMFDIPHYRVKEVKK